MDIGGLNFQVCEFYGDKINFFYNDESVLIGAGSLINGMGLSFGRQLEKIKKESTLFSHMCKIRAGWAIRKIHCFYHEGLNPFFDSINMTKVKEELRDKISLYKNEFYQFTCDSFECCKQIEKEDFYLGTKEGLRCLIWDSVIRLGNENAIKQIADTLYPLLNIDLIGNTDLPVIEKERSPKISRLYEKKINEIRANILNVPNPILNMAEKTSERHKEVKRYKSESIASQLLEISDRVREVKDKNDAVKLSREINRISKSIH